MRASIAAAESSGWLAAAVLGSTKALVSKPNEQRRDILEGILKGASLASLSRKASVLQPAVGIDQFGEV